MINKRIGAFIATLRKEQNLTQEQFAEKLNVSNRSVSRWENGNTLPDLSLMQHICEITGITLPKLLNGVRQDPSAERKDSIFLILSLWDREKQAKTKTLNLWFSLGLISLLATIVFAQIVSPAVTLLLVCFGIFFHGLGFYHNNRDPKLTDGEKQFWQLPAILSPCGIPRNYCPLPEHTRMYRLLSTKPLFVRSVKIWLSTNRYPLRWLRTNTSSIPLPVSGTRELP